MAKKAYVGVNGVAREVSKIYVGVNGVARKVVKGYVGVNGVAQQFWGNNPIIENEYNYQQGQSYQIHSLTLQETLDAWWDLFSEYVYENGWYGAGYNHLDNFINNWSTIRSQVLSYANDPSNQFTSGLFEGTTILVETGGSAATVFRAYFSKQTYPKTVYVTDVYPNVIPKGYTIVDIERSGAPYSSNEGIVRCENTSVSTFNTDTSTKSYERIGPDYRERHTSSQNYFVLSLCSCGIKIVN